MITLRAFSTETGSIVIQGKVPSSGELMADAAEFSASMEYSNPVKESDITKTIDSFENSARERIHKIPGLREMARWLLDEVLR